MPVEIGIERLVYQLKSKNGSTCTAFYMPYKSKEYLVTAKHFLEKAHTDIELCVDEDWKPIKGTGINSLINYIDISAIDISGQNIVSPNEMLIPKYSCEGITIGDDCYFIGFPYGLKSIFAFKDDPLAKFTFPLVKRATVSAAVIDDNNKNIGFYMDGHNNPGFSGGPCIKHSAKAGWILFGVVSGYIPQENVLYDEEMKPKIVLSENSGIFKCANIIHIFPALDVPNQESK